MLNINPISFTSNDNKRIHKDRINPSLLPPTAPTLKADTFSPAFKEKPSLSGILTSFVGSLLGVKKAELPPINKDELEKLRSQFKDLFMREDISLNDTKEMIKRYQEICKIKDKTEYTKAIYEEAKNNFGFGDIDLPLDIRKGEVSEYGETMGSSPNAMNEIVISPNARKDKIANYVHHELRHMKQHYYCANYDIKGYYSAVYNSLLHKGKAFNLTEKQIAELCDDFKSRIEARWGELSPNNVPDDKLDFVHKCIEAENEYYNGHENPDAYEVSFVEKDARHAGSIIDNILTTIKDRKIAE